jgi:hypothetical protein
MACHNFPHSRGSSRCTLPSQRHPRAAQPRLALQSKEKKKSGLVDKRSSVFVPHLAVAAAAAAAAAAGPANERQRVTGSQEKSLIPNEVDSKLPMLQRGFWPLVGQQLPGPLQL